MIQSLVVVTNAVIEVLALLCVVVLQILQLDSFFVQTANVAHDALYSTYSRDGCPALLCLLVPFDLLLLLLLLLLL